jgi:hypothetical protein
MTTRRASSEVDLYMETMLTELFGAQNFLPEYQFAKPRRWRFDWAVFFDRTSSRAPWIKSNLAIEVDGGVWIRGGGRHNRGAGFIRDMEKTNVANCLGWSILRFTPQMVLKGEARRVIEIWLKWRGLGV